jgi:membrane peptidoglycan carboxypeptidase
MPNNFNGDSNGLVSVRKALSGSLNIPAVKMLYLVGVDRAIDFAENLGMTTFTDRNRYGLSLVLGGGEVKLVEEVGAFSVFANDGVRAPVHGIARVIDPSGKELQGAPQPERVINEEVARKINSVLSDNDARSYIFGSRSALYFKDRQVAAKTGTTQDYRDALTVGYTPEIAVGVWVGNNDNKPMRGGSDGSVVAAPLWHTFMERELASLPDTQFTPYQKIESKNLMVTGIRPSDAGGDGEMTYVEKDTGKRISAEKARKMDKDKLEERYTHAYGGHDILYYIDKDHPLDETAKPNYNDPMLHLWDKGLNGDYEKDKKED